MHARRILHVSLLLAALAAAPLAATLGPVATRLVGESQALAGTRPVGMGGEPLAGSGLAAAGREPLTGTGSAAASEGGDASWFYADEHLALARALRLDAGGLRAALGLEAHGPLVAALGSGVAWAVEAAAAVACTDAGTLAVRRESLEERTEAVLSLAAAMVTRRERYIRIYNRDLAQMISTRDRAVDCGPACRAAARQMTSRVLTFKSRYELEPLPERAARRVASELMASLAKGCGGPEPPPIDSTTEY